MRGRKTVATFGNTNKHMAETATIATSKGIYVVESLLNGLYYFLDGDECVVATSAGYMRIELETAKTIAKELTGIVDDYKAVRRSGRKPVSERAISKMLEV